MGFSREELLNSPDWHLTEIQELLFREISQYLKKNNITQTQFAEQLGCTKSYISQIMNGNFDHRMSKFVELSLAIGRVPTIEFKDIEIVLKESDKSKRSEPLEFDNNSSLKQAIENKSNIIKGNKNVKENYQYC